MTSNAFKIGTVLHAGWFWPRFTGCSLLYRGGSIDSVNFDEIVAVGNLNATAIEPPDYLQHRNNTTHFYVLRRANSCGSVEHTLSASAKVAIDNNGNPAEPFPNSIFIIKAETVNGSRIKLTWFYYSVDHQSRPVRFNIYTDSETGQIDYQNPVAQIAWQGRKFYNYTSDELDEGKYLFAIRVVNNNDIEDTSLKTVSIELQPNQTNLLIIEQ
jgi:hypothetical protein